MLLNSQIKKIEKIGLKINGFTTIGNFEYELFTNMNCTSRVHFALNVRDLRTNEYKTLCTRANIDTAYNKALEHIKANREEA